VKIQISNFFKLSFLSMEMLHISYRSVYFVYVILFTHYFNLNHLCIVSEIMLA